MKRKNAARNALFTSILSLLLCVSMLVGTTFAWFTDEVVSGNNVIKSGTLDIEFLWGETADTITTDASQGAIFDYQFWEPGYTEVRYVKIANVGNLALRYRLNINPNMQVKEGEANLAEVIEVRMIPVADAKNMNRAQMLAVNPVGTLATLMADVDGAAHGILLPDPSVEAPDVKLNDGEVADIGAVEYCIVLHMQEEAGNEYQNLSVGKGFSVQLLATQYTYEEDSFDNMYDDGAEYDDAPNANVTTFDPQMIPTSTHGDVLLEAGFQFQPEETEEEGAASPYAKWHADFVVYSDRDIPANAVILPGYYAAYCDDHNEGKWVGLSSDETIPANEQIRLIDVLGDLMGYDVTVNYEEICKWGNDNVGFKCGVSVDEAQRAAIAGTTITVELRLYEVPDKGECSNGGGCNHAGTDCETGEYKTIGTYTYTIPAETPAIEASTLTELNDALKAGAKVIDANGANLGEFYYDAVFTDGAVIKNAKFEYFYGGNVEGTVTFENCEFVSDHSYSANFDSGNGNIIFNNCLFDGWSSFGTAITNVEMNNCTFQKSYSYGMLRFYQTAQLNNCTFADNFEGVDTNVTGYKVEMNNCTGIDGKIYNNGDNKGIWFVNGTDISDTVTSW